MKQLTLWINNQLHTTNTVIPLTLLYFTVADILNREQVHNYLFQDYYSQAVLTNFIREK